MPPKTELESSNDLHSLALVTHGFLVFGHTLGLVYGAKTKHWLHSWLHLSGVLLSICAARCHAKELQCKINT